MKFFLLHSVLLFSLYNNVFTYNKDEKCAKVFFVNQYITTPFRIDCDQFETSFSDQYKKLNINNSKEINLLNFYKKNIKLSKKPFTIDVRIKIYFYDSKNKLNILCMDSGGNAMINGNTIAPNTALKKLVFGWCHYL